MPLSKLKVNGANGNVVVFGGTRLEPITDPLSFSAIPLQLRLVTTIKLF